MGFGSFVRENWKPLAVGSAVGTLLLAGQMSLHPGDRPPEYRPHQAAIQRLEDIQEFMDEAYESTSLAPIIPALDSLLSETEAEVQSLSTPDLTAYLAAGHDWKVYNGIWLTIGLLGLLVSGGKVVVEEYRKVRDEGVWS